VICACSWITQLGDPIWYAEGASTAGWWSR
jgi:hypothetical protein